jgi:DtxR family Mn-dependent transcriptional regulator
MAPTATTGHISSPLEDYLETIYLLVQDHGFARVKDISRARDVKAPTVSVALKKLADEGLVQYSRREYIGLTQKGEEAARRVFARHRLLTRFFEEVLKMPPNAACDQACALEHSLTDEAMDRLASLFESLGNCPAVIDTFRQCQIGALPTGKAARLALPKECTKCTHKGDGKSPTLADLKPGQRAVVTQIATSGALRQRLLDMGILPETPVDLDRVGLGGDPLWIRCQGARLALRKSEAKTIRIRREA